MQQACLLVCGGDEGPSVGSGCPRNGKAGTRHDGDTRQRRQHGGCLLGCARRTQLVSVMCSQVTSRHASQRAMRKRRRQHGGLLPREGATDAAAVRGMLASDGPVPVTAAMRRQRRQHGDRLYGGRAMGSEWVVDVLAGTSRLTTVTHGSGGNMAAAFSCGLDGHFGGFARDDPTSVSGGDAQAAEATRRSASSGVLASDEPARVTA